jgi:environmental stress-induced protein Ves
MQGMRVFRAADRRFAAWKNGGGETAEILVFPEAAGFDDFGWRISTAKVAASGPFSNFPGVQRCLTVVAGGTMRLSFGDGTRHEIGPGSNPIYFSGDLACECELPGAPLLDLNVMFRVPFHGEVYRLSDEPPDHMPLRRFLFAVEALPELGLVLHDVADITGMRLPSPGGNALVIEIIR